MLFLLLACSEKISSETMTEISANYAEIVHTSYTDSVTTAQDLDAEIGAFLDAPSDAALTAAQDAWLDSREPYLQTEVYRFYDGPIDNPDTGVEGMLNAWPLDEAYIDYTADDAAAGIINDTAVTIDADTLMSMNEQGGEENIATGFHAIEFLLWGQDFSADSAGTRPYTDFVADGSGTAANQDRRALYLETASSLMIEHLQEVQGAWAADAENYRSEFLAMDSEEQLRMIMTGMIILTGFETGGERLQTALDSGDQEDEHSCFSDNTHRDMIQDVQGVQNIYLGQYGSVSGVGIKDIVAEVDTDLAERIDTEIQAALDAGNAMQIPFDNEIAMDNTDGRDRVQTLITSLRTVEQSLEEAFRAFGLAVPVAE
jgi:putative iron-regulated protein